MTTTIKKLVEHVRVHVRCGLHSGFRPCCVAWFIGPWQLVYRKLPRLRMAYFGVIDGLYGARSVQYVCCPACMVLGRKPVTVMECHGSFGSCVPTGETIETSKPPLSVVK